MNSNMSNNIELTIGRANARRADILIEGDTISALHAKIGIDEKDKYWIIDTNSKNGTYILNKGVKVSNVKTYLTPGDILSLGGVEVTFGYLNNYIANNFYIEENEESDSTIEMIRCTYCGSPTPKYKPCIKCGKG